MQTAIDALTASRTPFVANVWIDDHDMLRRMELDLPSLHVAQSGPEVDAVKARGHAGAVGPHIARALAQLVSGYGPTILPNIDAALEVLETAPRF